MADLTDLKLDEVRAISWALENVRWDGEGAPAHSALDGAFRKSAELLDRIAPKAETQNDNLCGHVDQDGFVCDLAEDDDVHMDPDDVPPEAYGAPEFVLNDIFRLHKFVSKTSSSTR